MHNDASLCKAKRSLYCISLLFDYVVSEGNFIGIELDVDMAMRSRGILYNVTSLYKKNSGKAYMEKRSASIRICNSPTLHPKIQLL